MKVPQLAQATLDVCYMNLNIVLETAVKEKGQEFNS